MAEVARKPPQHLEELMAKAEEFINAGETIKAFTNQAKKEKSPERRKVSRRPGRDMRACRAENHFAA
jgi:hypothetical protein